ncbi:MAG TPA: hypothetical protein DIS94_03320, partial [Bacteroidetes bacterium]|nr:hypothetical protein [Bacteroidota bacterium]
SAIKNFCSSIEKDNKRNFDHLNPFSKYNKLTPDKIENFKIYFDKDRMFSMFMDVIINKSEYYVTVDKDWKQKLLKHFSLNTIRTNQNIQNQKNKKYEHKKN